MDHKKNLLGGTVDNPMHKPKAKGEPPAPSKHVTIVSHKGTVKFWKMSPEERKNFMRGGNRQRKLADAKRTAEVAELVKHAMFNEERDAMLRLLDPVQMKGFFEKWQQPLPENWDNVALGIMHAARTTLPGFSEAEKADSRAYLFAHGLASHAIAPTLGAAPAETLPIAGQPAAAAALPGPASAIPLPGYPESGTGSPAPSLPGQAGPEIEAEPGG